MSEPERRPTWAVTILIGVVTAVLVSSSGYFKNEGREQGQGETSIAEMSRRMDERFDQIRRDIERVDSNSQGRRAEIREEMTALHNQQQREIEELKAEIRRKPQ